MELVLKINVPENMTAGILDQLDGDIQDAMNFLDRTESYSGVRIATALSLTPVRPF